MGNGSGQIDIEALLRLELDKGVPRLLRSEKFQNAVKDRLLKLLPKKEAQVVLPPAPLRPWYLVAHFHRPPP
jgi:hypothetical protein